MKKVFIENSQIKLGVNLSGGALTSVFDKKRNEELLWQGNPDYWKFQDVVIFPLMGNPQGGYNCKGKNYTFDMGHGVCRFSEFTVVENKGEELVIELVANEATLAKYPFNFRVKLTYTLIGRGYKLTYNISNLDGEEMPFYVGAHAAFNLTGGDTKVVFDKCGEYRHFPIRNGRVADESEIAFTGNEVLLNREWFAANDSMVLDRTFEGNCKMVRSDGLSYNYDISDCTTLTLWAYKAGAEFACVEPWWGIGQTVSADIDIYKKPRMNFVKGDSKDFCYSCTIED